MRGILLFAADEVRRQVGLRGAAFLALMVVPAVLARWVLRAAVFEGSGLDPSWFRRPLDPETGRRLMDALGSTADSVPMLGLVLEGWLAPSSAAFAYAAFLLLPWACLVLAFPAVAADRQNNGIRYFFLRVPRWSYGLGRWLGVLAVAAIIGWAVIGGAVASSDLDPAVAARDAWVLGRAFFGLCVAYTGLGFAVSAATSRPARALLWGASLLSVLPLVVFVASWWWPRVASAWPSAHAEALLRGELSGWMGTAGFAGVWVVGGLLALGRADA
jgi:hypothetical protein